MMPGPVLTLPWRRLVATHSGPSRRSLRSLRVSLPGYRTFRLCSSIGPEGPLGPGPPPPRNVLAARPSRHGSGGTSTTRETNHHRKAKQSWQPQTPSPSPETSPETPSCASPPTAGPPPASAWRQQRLDRPLQRGAARVHRVLRRRGVGQAGGERRPVPLQGPRGRGQRPAPAAQLAHRPPRHLRGRGLSGHPPPPAGRHLHAFGTTAHKQGRCGRRKRGRRPRPVRWQPRYPSSQGLRAGRSPDRPARARSGPRRIYPSRLSVL